MTVEELSQIYYINKEITSLQLELTEIKQKNFYKPNILSDMPGGGEARDQSLEYVNGIMELEDMLNYSLRRLQYQRKKVERFLQTIENAELRLIMRLRAVNNMKWEDIGSEVGVERTTASKKFYKYFENN